MMFLDVATLAVNQLLRFLLTSLLSLSLTGGHGKPVRRCVPTSLRRKGFCRKYCTRHWGGTKHHNTPVTNAHISYSEAEARSPS